MTEIPERLRFCAAQLDSRAGQTTIPVVGIEIRDRLLEIADELEAGS